MEECFQNCNLIILNEACQYVLRSILDSMRMFGFLSLNKPLFIKVFYVNNS